MKLLTPNYDSRPERPCVKCGVLFLGHRCKICQKQAKKTYIENNREKVNASNSKWREKNPEKMKTWIKDWALRNPEKCKASSVKSAAKRGDIRKIESSEWRKKNPVQVKKNWVSWASQNKERLRETKKKYEFENSEKVRASKHTRRIRQLQIDSVIDANYIKFLIVVQGMKCVYCDKTMIAYQIDHIFPIAKGGTNENSNLQLLCPLCNRKKGAKTDLEFREYLNVIHS